MMMKAVCWVEEEAVERVWAVLFSDLMGGCDGFGEGEWGIQFLLLFLRVMMIFHLL